MFRECDAEGTFLGYVDAYDEDASGLLEGEEAEAVEREHGSGRPGPREHFAHLLRVVYDADQSGEFEGGELDALFADFTTRCEAIHEAVLADYDADGDGVLSEDEEASARAGHQATVAAMREQHAACRQEQAPERPERGGAPFGPLEQEFDADGSGDLSAEELETLRVELRARIVSGAPPHPDCGA